MIQHIDGLKRLGPFSIYIYNKNISNTTMKHHDEYESRDSYDHRTIKQKLEDSIKKYIKLKKKKNSIENEMANLSRNIEKYKLSFDEST